MHDLEIRVAATLLNYWFWFVWAPDHVGIIVVVVVVVVVLNQAIQLHRNLARDAGACNTCAGTLTEYVGIDQT